MVYFKRILQLAFLFAVIWLTIQNYEVKCDLKLFNKEIKDASVILIIFFSMILGSIITVFFSAVKELKNNKIQRKLRKDLRRTNKDLELKTKDLVISKNEMEKLQTENDHLNSEIKTLKEIIKYPKDNSIADDRFPKLID